MTVVRRRRLHAVDGRRCFCGHGAVGDWRGWLDGPGDRATLHLSVCARHRCVADWPPRVRLGIEGALLASGGSDEAAVLCDEFDWYS